MPKKYIAVIGAAGGIGKVTTNLLIKQGFIVFACDVNTDNLVKEHKKGVIPVKIDITIKQSVIQALNVIKQSTNALQGLVNIAGTFDQFALVESQDDAFQRLLNANLIGPQLVTSLFFPLLKNAEGRIVNLSSETVLAQMPLQAYAFSKKLFDTWNTQLRMELRLLNMKVIVVRAGGHQTPFIQKSKEVLTNFDKESKFVNLYDRAKKVGVKQLDKKQNDPVDVAMVISKALILRTPKHVYHVNVSLLYRCLSFIPQRIRELLIVVQMKKWMKAAE